MTRVGWLRRWGGVACALPLVGCGVFADKPPTVQFPVARSAPFDVWSSSGGATSASVIDSAQVQGVNPFDPIALNNMAVAEAANGRYQQALSLLQRAVKLAPARADIAANLANIRQWLAQAEGQAALGLEPQRLQLPYQESAAVPVPPLWSTSNPLPAQPAPLVQPARQERMSTPQSTGAPLVPVR